MDKVLARRGGWSSGLFGGDLRGRFLLPPTTPGKQDFEGRLRWEGSEVAVFIKNPPRRGVYVHERCLQYVDSGWFRLHFVTPPRSLEAAVVFTEDYLLCCLRGW
jgi:hypothetical protein